MEIYDNGNLIWSRSLSGDAVFDTGFPCPIPCPPVNILPVPSFSLRLGTADPVSLRYRSPRGSMVTFPGASFAHDVTLDLFVRDPSEYQFHLETATFGLPDPWVTEMASARGYPVGEQGWSRPPYLLPNAVQLSYRGAYPAQYTSFDPVLPHVFWGANIRPSPETAPWPTSYDDWGPPGNEPLGWGSIKTLRAVAHSICESEIPVQDVLNAIRLVLPRELNSHCFEDVTILDNWPVGIIVAADVNTLSASSFLSRTHQEIAGIPPQNWLGGGFDLWGEFYVHAHGGLGIFDKTCTADVAYRYPWGLDDGFVFANGNGLSGQFAGDSEACGPMKNLVSTAFDVELPDMIRKRAKGLQKYATHGKCSVHRDPLTGLFARSCKTPADNLLFVARLGAEKLFGGFANVPPQLLADLDIGTHDGADNADGTRNWECEEQPQPVMEPGSSSTPTCATQAPIPEADRDYTCNFIMRAKSLVVNPDSIDLVWFDDLLDHSTCSDPNVCVHPHAGSLPGVVLFLYSFLGGDVGQLCDRPLFRTDGYVARYFATVHQGKVTCADTLGGPPDRCCTSVVDCFASETCDTTYHRCGGGLCKFDYECPAFQRCNGNTGRCATYSQQTCDVRDPFPKTSASKMVCEYTPAIRPWFAPARGPEPRRR